MLELNGKAQQYNAPGLLLFKISVTLVMDSFRGFGCRSSKREKQKSTGGASLTDGRNGLKTRKALKLPAMPTNQRCYASFKGAKHEFL